MMRSTVQPSAYDPRDAEILGTAVPANDPGPPRSPKVETAEFGSGWYHDAAIAASAQAPTRRT